MNLDLITNPIPIKTTPLPNGAMRSIGNASSNEKAMCVSVPQWGSGAEGKNNSKRGRQQRRRHSARW